MNARSFPSAGTAEISQGQDRHRISIVLGCDSHMTCDLLLRVLKRYKAFNVMACFVNSEEALLAIQQLAPDIALISSAMSDGQFRGFRLLHELRSANTKCRVVMMLDEELDDDLAVDAFRGGARGVFNKSAPLQYLSKCIFSVYKGQIWASNAHVQRALETLQKAVPLRCLNHRGESLLSKREQEIVPLIGEGLTNKEISTRLNLSEHTIKNHLFRIYEKLGISSRVELILYAVTHRNAA